MMRVKIIVLVALVFCMSMTCFALSQTELNVLRYQLQMPTVTGNAIGFRTIGTLEEGAFGLVWRLDNRSGLFTGQVLAFNKVLEKWVSSGVFEWSSVYFDVFLLLRF